ncbi:MAG: pyruvate:ferredoxin (flavodoxin) oxidoreductase [Anaerolineae bacterium]|nr:pyruvate:ferredoxin (flavodoxin) oxidoreductase [Anaerolineae bacterium]
MKKHTANIDGNEATAYVAHKTSEVIAIYPITPSSTMGEYADEWSAKKRPNLWGTIPLVVEMQSEGGAAGAVHGALQAGALSTTFTASQGLLLMIPNMYKIAGELTSTVFHVSARSLAVHALSIFGDHSDVMSTRSTGFALLASNSVQEAHDFALIAQASTLEARVPFVHFFDGFRTSAEVNKIEILSDDEIRTMISDELIRAHRSRALSPDHPMIRGTAQNPDVYFQGREAGNPYFSACPEIVQKVMDKFAATVGRKYNLFDYVGAPDAERVIILMGSGAETAGETALYLNKQGEKVAVIKVRLYRPFSNMHLLNALPKTVKTVAVLDRTKEPGAAGEPLYLDVVNAIYEGGRQIKIIGGRYGLSSKEFTPAMVKSVFDEMSKAEPKNHFTVGITDDVSMTSLQFDPSFNIETPEITRAVFWGLGADGTVGANKNSIKIIGEETDNYAQGYFVYDSKKSGGNTISHLRFGPKPIHAPYLISHAQFVGCHQFNFLERFDVLKFAMTGGVFLLNSLYGPDEVWDYLPREVQQTILQKKLRFFVINAYEVAKQTGMGVRINTVMQTCFFAISGVLPRDEAITQIKKGIKKSYSKFGEAVVKKNYNAVDQTLVNLHEVNLAGKSVTSTITRRPQVPEKAPEFVKDVLGKIIGLEGDDLPVSAFPVDGTYPLGTTQWEKRNISLEMPEWVPDLCIQCGKCVFVCPHAVIRAKIYEPQQLTNAPATFKSMDAKFKEFPDTKYTVQVSPEDCTGCALCVETCPAKDKSQVGRKALNMVEQLPRREQESANWEFFQALPVVDRAQINLRTLKNTQLLEPLFEFSLACTGCGETPYVKLLTQLFGDRLLVANATGCSSIYGGNLPTTPWTVNRDGRGPSWSNSLFEDNAEFGFGFRLTIDKQNEYARELLPQLANLVGEPLVTGLLNADQTSEAGIKEQRERVDLLKTRLNGVKDPRARDLLSLADLLGRKSVWILGGDGWAYDIGYGGLDHVLAMGRNVNMLVLDTEVYSNTGGQSSTSTPRGAVAKFAANGKGMPKKDLGLIAMSYGYVYVARVAMGASDQQTLNAFLEADAHDGPSLIIAYSHCINHGIDMRRGLEQQKLAVQSGIWPLYRYNPRLVEEGKNPLTIDSKDPSIPLEQYAYNEPRYKMLTQTDEERAEMLLKQAQQDVKSRWDLYKQMAAMHYGNNDGNE